MNGKLPRVTASDVIKVLEKIGFSFSRQSGSHKIYKNKSGRRVTVSYHGRKVIHLRTLKSILRDSDLTVYEFKELMK